MQFLQIRGVSQLSPSLDVSPSDSASSFGIQGHSQFAESRVEIGGDGTTISVLGGASVSDDLFIFLDQATEETIVPREHQTELFYVVRGVFEATRTVLGLVEQELGILQARTIYSGSTEWSQDNKAWREFPFGGIRAAIRTRPRRLLDERRRMRIQTLLDAGEKPLLAYQQLQEADRTRAPRSQWVIGTIAAELAVKEILARLEPKLEVVFENLPSPPLHVLYGRVLKELAGELSPYKKVIENGAKVRNQIVHNPKSTEPDAQAVIDYLDDVENAIHHLLGLQSHRKSTNESNSLERGV